MSRAKPVPAGDLEGNSGHLPGPPRRTQRLLNAPHLQHEHPPGAELDGPAQRDTVDQPAVEIVAVLDHNRR
jgi:hypothetical protein